MSIHKSLKISGGMARQRNVFNRWERLQKLKEAGRWSDDMSIYGLPKVRTRFPSAVKKKKKKEEDTEDKKAAKK